MSKLKNLGANLALIFGSLAFGVLIGEIGLRVAGIEGFQKIGDTVDSAPTDFHTSDPDRGWSLIPGKSGDWQGEGEKSHIQINSDGLRDGEHSKGKPKNTLRIAMLGDSFTEAIHVPIGKTFWYKLGRKFERCSALKGQKVEVINFGVQGYGTAQELITLEKKVWAYAPDIVILAFFNGNDVINNSRQLEYDQYRPFFVYQNGKLVPDMSFRQLSPVDRNRNAVSFIDRLPGWLVNNSRILQVVKKADLELKKREINDEFTKLVAQNFKEPENSTWKEAWQVTEGLIERMRDEVAQKKAKFLVVSIGDPIQVHPAPSSRQAFMQQNQITDLFYPEHRLQALGAREGFEVLTLAQPFQDYAEKNKVCLHGFENVALCQGHWNPEGHRLAATLIADKLCEDFSKVQTKQDESQIPKR